MLYRLWEVKPEKAWAWQPHSPLDEPREATAVWPLHHRALNRQKANTFRRTFNSEMLKQAASRRSCITRWCVMVPVIPILEGDLEPGETWPRSKSIRSA